MARSDPQLKIRLPKDAKLFIEDEAKHNSSSQTSEVVRAIRAAMKAKGPAVEGHSFADLTPLSTHNPSNSQAGTRFVPNGVDTGRADTHVED